MARQTQADQSHDVTQVSQHDICGYLKPIAVLGRMPDATGISQHLLSLHRTLADVVELITYDVNDLETCLTLNWDWPRFAAVIVTESVVHQPVLVQMLRRLAGSLPRLLVLAWDSDRLDPQEIEVVNQAFDHVLADNALLADHWSRQVAPHVGWHTFPLNLDLRARSAGVQPRSRRSWSPIVVGCIAAFHPRKRHDVVVDLVADLIAEGENVELLMHSNLQHGDGFERTRRYAEQRLGERALVTNNDKTPSELTELYHNIDVFVSLSQGETYNVPLRDALAAGIPCVISDIPGHHDLVGRYGVVAVPAGIPVPASYPERGGIVCGIQYQCTHADALPALRGVVRAVRVGLGPDPYSVSETGLASDSRVKIAPMFDVLRGAGALQLARIGSRSGTPSSASAGPVIKPPRRLVLLAHDAGFFSLYNTYASHVAWWQDEERSAGFDQVLADWSVRALERGVGLHEVESFCYASPSEGNAFFKLFENPFPELQLDEARWLADLDGAELLTNSFNAKVDPYLTYKNAARLYRSLGFAQWRKRMARVVSSHLKPLPEVCEALRKSLRVVPDDASKLSMHVRHPSHAVEQPDGSIASVDDFIRVAEGWLQTQHAGVVLLATDQESVVTAFRRELGDSVACRDGVVRTSEEDDARFRESARSGVQLGHQIQHLTASNPSSWSSAFARDVMLDMLFLAQGELFIHTTSNVATAVAMQSPDIAMMHIRGSDTWSTLQARTLLEQRIRVV
jgi:glycosyltransferase involved in cell wall biosynthesis